MARYKDIDWNLDDCSAEVAQIAVLMDIRDELKRLNSLISYQEPKEITEESKDS